MSDPPVDRWSNTLARYAVAVALASMASACSPVAAVVEPAAPVHQELDRRPIEKLVAAAGLRWMIIGKLSQIATDPRLSANLNDLFPKARLDSYQSYTGIDLRSVKTAIIAQYATSTLYVVDPVHDAFEVERGFRDRWISPVSRSVFSDGAVAMAVSRTATSGLEGVAALGPDIVAVELGGDTHLRASVAFLTGTLKKAKRAMQLSELQDLATQDRDELAVGYALGPFEDAWSGAAGGLLGASLAASASLKMLENGALQVRMALLGPWATDQSRAARLAQSTWTDWASSSLGNLLGLDEPVSPPRIAVGPRVLTLTVTVSPEKLLSRLHNVVSSPIEDLMRDVGSATHSK